MIESCKSEVHNWWNLPAWDRRRATRFPIEIDLQCRFGSRLREVAHGRTVNISSSGILIRTHSRPFRGSRAHLVLVWPALLDDQIPLRLFVEGGVARTDGDLVAIVFRRVEFRTAGVAGDNGGRTVVKLASTS